MQELSDFIIFDKYAKWLETSQRRENYTEIVDRYLRMLTKKFGNEDDLRFFDERDHHHRYKDIRLLSNNIVKKITYYGKLIHDQKILPSMRALQFAGPAIEKNNSRMYNCAYTTIDHYKAFSEIMFLLLGGSGVGYNIHKEFIQRLPSIRKAEYEQKFIIEDSIEGWSHAVNILMKSYLGKTNYRPRFDYSSIRKKGERLITAGGKAPGPEPLKRCLENIKSILDSKDNGDQLKDIEIHDIICYIADAVRAGGIRRAALISLFTNDSEDMLKSKSGQWWIENGQRGRANNSAIFNINTLKEEQFRKVLKDTEESNSGEPGVFLTNDIQIGANPCCEIALNPNQFCNLVEINGATVKSKEDFIERCQAASFFASLQASYTDFHFLRPVWKRITEKESLIGVGITGICNGPLLRLVKELGPGFLEEGARFVVKENMTTSKEIGINPASRTTTIKPSGTSSCVLSNGVPVFSGIHAGHSNNYLRTVQQDIASSAASYFIENHPEMVKTQDSTAFISFPCKVDDPNAILRENETAVQMLERVKLFHTHWIRPGHREGQNTNNVSATVSVKPEEWKAVTDWMWDNRHSYHGISLLPYDGGSYENAPFQEVDLEIIIQREEALRENPIELSDIKETQDNTDLMGEIACAGGSCEIL